MALSEKWQQLMWDAVETRYSMQEDLFLSKQCERGLVRLFIVPWTRKFKVTVNKKVKYEGRDFEKALEFL